MPPPPSKEHTISLNLQQITTPPPITKPQPRPTPIKPEKKEVLKQKYLDTSKKIFAQKSEEENNSTENEQKATPIKNKVQKKKIEKTKKIVQKNRKIQKRRVKKLKVRKQTTKRSKDPLANMLMGSGSSLFTKKAPPSQSRSYGEQTIKQLYGNEFNTFSPTQKKFIRRNLSTIHQITQRTLTRNGYPNVAVRTKQQGTNIVSFYLHPNGDITGLKLKRAIGYEALDKNTLKVIRIAYKDYPLPNKKTKIIFYITYRLY